MSKVEIDKADLDGRNTKIKQQGERIKELEEQAEKFAQSSNSNSENFTKEDQEELGELYAPMKRLVEASVGGLAVGMNKNFSGITKSIESLQSNIENQNKSLFSGVAAKTIDKYSDIKDTQEFKDILASRIPGTSITYGDSWADAQNRNSMSEMQEIVDMVQIAETVEGEAEEEAEANFEPAGGSSAKEMPMSTQFKFKATDLQKKVDEFKAGTLSTEAYEEYQKVFYEAVDKGQVLDDSEQN